MTDNLVQELKDLSVLWPDGVAMRAANRIEKLEAALRTIYECCDETGNCSVVRRIARKTLEGKDD